MVKSENKSSRTTDKTRTVAFRISHSDYEKLQNRAGELGIDTVSDYLRAIVREEDIKIRNVYQEDPEKLELLKELIFQIRKIGVNINQIAYGVNVGLNVPDNFYTKAEEELLKISRSTKHVLSELEKDFEFKER